MRSALRWLSSLLFGVPCALLTLAATAEAQAEPAATSSSATTPAPGAVAAPVEDRSGAAPVLSEAQKQWDARYASARAQVLDGEFAEAGRALAELAAAAPDAERARVASELGSIARAWQSRGVHLVNAPLEAREAKAQGRRKRSMDEISGLYLQAVPYGVLTSLTVSALAEADTEAGIFFPMVLFTGASLGAVAMLDQTRLNYGVPQAIVAGSYIGVEEGALGLWIASDSGADLGRKGVLGTLWSATTVGAIGGGLLSGNLGTTPGQASYVHSGGLWTGLTALLLSFGVAPRDDVHRGLVSGVGYNVGLLAATLTAGAVQPRVSRVRFLDLGAVAGGLTAVGLLAGAGADEQAAGFGVALGVVGGMATTWYLTRDFSPDTPDVPGLDVHASLAPVRGGAVLGLNGTW